MRILRELVKHIKIYGMLLRINVMSQMEYRTNFVTGILMEAGYLVTKVLYVVVTYRAGRSIAGFSPDEILVFIGTFVLMTGFYAGVYMMNFFQLSPMVRDGSFDTLMTKPVSLQFMATFRRSDVGIFTTDAAAGLVLVCVGLARMGAGVNVLHVVGYALFIASGMAVGYSLYLIPQSFVFRVVNSSSIAEFTDSFWDFNNVPMVVYGKIGRAIGVYLIPMFVVTSFPALFALGKLSTVYTIWGIAAPFIFLAIARLLWKSGIRNYTSASG